MGQSAELSCREVSRLLKKSRRGDMQSFRVIVETYQSYAYALAYRVLVNQEDAEDAVQEAFLRVWRHSENYTPENKFTTWLYTVVTNVCYDRLRQRKRTEAYRESESGSTPGYTMDSQNEHEDLLRVLHNRLGILPERQRIVFILRDLQNLSVRDVAAILDISESAVKTNLHYARKQLQTILKDIKN